MPHVVISSVRDEIKVCRGENVNINVIEYSVLSEIDRGVLAERLRGVWDQSGKLYPKCKRHRASANHISIHREEGTRVARSEVGRSGGYDVGVGVWQERVLQEGNGSIS